ncbi:MAG TPA: hypothetical protein VF003_16480 [Pseudonocardiaceae bacterium]
MGEKNLHATLQAAGSPHTRTIPNSSPPTAVESVQAIQAVEAIWDDADT